MIESPESMGIAMNKVTLSGACYPTCYYGHSQQVQQALYHKLDTFLTLRCAGLPCCGSDSSLCCSFYQAVIYSQRGRSKILENV